MLEAGLSVFGLKGNLMVCPQGTRAGLFETSCRPPTLTENTPVRHLARVHRR